MATMMMITRSFITFRRLYYTTPHFFFFAMSSFSFPCGFVLRDLPFDVMDGDSLYHATRFSFVALGSGLVGR
jgi:hypothetical protein